MLFQPEFTMTSQCMAQQRLFHESVLPGPAHPANSGMTPLTLFVWLLLAVSVDFRVQHIVRRVALSMHCRPARTARRFLWHLLIGLTVAIYVFQKAFKKIMVTLPGPTQAEAVSVTWL